MKKVILTESELTRLIKRIINEQNQPGLTAPISLQYLYDADLINEFLTSSDVDKIYELGKQLMSSQKNEDWNSKLLGNYEVFEDYFAMNPSAFSEFEKRLESIRDGLVDGPDADPELVKKSRRKLGILYQHFSDINKKGQSKYSRVKNKIDNLQPCRRIDDATIESINNSRVMIVNAFDNKVLMFRDGQPICVMR
jgi:hypothetical protein